MELVPPVSPDPLPWVIAFKYRDADAELALAVDWEREAEADAAPVDTEVIEVVATAPLEVWKALRAGLLHPFVPACRHFVNCSAVLKNSTGLGTRQNPTWWSRIINVILAPSQKARNGHNNYWKMLEKSNETTGVETFGFGLYCSSSKTKSP